MSSTPSEDAISELMAEVAVKQTAESSAQILIHGIAAHIEINADKPEVLREFAERLRASATDLAEAVTENTTQ